MLPRLSVRSCILRLLLKVVFQDFYELVVNLGVGLLCQGLSSSHDGLSDYLGWEEGSQKVDCEGF
uniref:Uncharacterized protein n=1 Tax=Pseudomonas phage KV2023 TaxID=3234047 RepID=A0AB39C711_9CAUD